MDWRELSDERAFVAGRQNSMKYFGFGRHVMARNGVGEDYSFFWGVVNFAGETIFIGIRKEELSCPLLLGKNSAISLRLLKAANASSEDPAKPHIFIRQQHKDDVP